MARSHDPQVNERLSVYVDDLDTSIHDVRKVIFSLQEPDDHVSGLRGEILRTAENSSEILGHEPQLSMRGPIDSIVGDTIRPELIAVLNEALSNVAKHAHATQCAVDVYADTVSRTVTLTVTDDGTGLDPQAPAGNGTVNMPARARKLGGTWSLGPGPRGGAVMTWSVPLDPPEG